MMSWLALLAGRRLAAPSLLALVVIAGGLGFVRQRAAGREATATVADSTRWLIPSRHPRFATTSRDFAEPRALARGTEWGRSHLRARRRATERFVAMSEAQLRALVPAPGSSYVRGIALNLDPEQNRPLEWGGWDDPFGVRSRSGVRYPNERWPDRGDGAPDPRTGTRRYFVALANSARVEELESNILPSLADVWALEGSEAHARAAAVLLDAIAGAYPHSRSGPLDYSSARRNPDAGGRLNRPGYQVGRGLVNYALVADLIAPSGALDAPSAALPGRTIRENVARNLLWDGAGYCLEKLQGSANLANGPADYLRGAAVVGLLLGEPALYSPLLRGPHSLEAFLTNSTSREGIHLESSTYYQRSSIEIYLSLAEIAWLLGRSGEVAVSDPYLNPRLGQVMDRPFDRLAVGGRVPAFGDSPPATVRRDPAERWFIRDGTMDDEYAATQALAAVVQLQRGPPAERGRWASLLRGMVGPGREFSAPRGFSRWMLYHMSRDALTAIRSAPAQDAAEPSSVLGGIGFALLRGRGPAAPGAALFFGPKNFHGHAEALTWTFYQNGSEWSFDPGNARDEFRTGWIRQSVAHQSLVVDQRNTVPGEGGGHLLAWNTEQPAQWALAAHPDAYRERGVTRFERMVAQVENPASGAGYWLDVGVVEGGRTRDDVFHSQMRRLEPQGGLQLTPTRELGAARDAREAFRDDPEVEVDEEGELRLGEGGYPFLRNARAGRLDRPATLTATQAAFHPDQGATLRVSLAGAPGRRLIIAESPEGRGRATELPSVPYLLARDAGPGESRFAKVVRVTAAGATDPIEGIVSLPVQRCGPGAGVVAAGAWLITWRGGDRDLWVVASEGAGRLCLRGPGNLSVTTDGLVSFIRFSGRGEPVRILASGAGEVAVGGTVAARGAGTLRGEVTAVPNADRPELSVRWTAAAPVMGRGTLLTTRPRAGQPSTWLVESAGGSRVTVRAPHLALGKTVLTSAPGGWLTPEWPLNAFATGPRGVSAAYARGKGVYQDGAFRGVLEADPAWPLRLRLAPPVRGPIAVTIAAMSPGDTVVHPANLSWSRR